MSVPRFTRGGLAMPEAVTVAAGKMAANKGKLNFASRDATTQAFNPAFWVKVPPPPGRKDPGRFEVRRLDDQGSPISPSTAVQDILQNPGLYKVECATAIKFVYYLAIIMHVGSGRFDRAVLKRRTTSDSGLAIGSGPYESLLADALKRETSSTAPPNVFPGMAPRDFVALLEPGDGVYMINLRPAPGAIQAGWSGENALYAGGGKFYGHGIPEAPDLLSAEEIQKKVKGHWDPTPGPATAIGPDRTGQANQEPWFVDEYFHPREDYLKTLGAD